MEKVKKAAVLFVVGSVLVFSASCYEEGPEEEKELETIFAGAGELCDPKLGVACRWSSCQFSRIWDFKRCMILEGEVCTTNDLLYECERGTKCVTDAEVVPIVYRCRRVTNEQDD